MITDWVGGVKKGQNLDYVIFEGSLALHFKWWKEVEGDDALNE